MICKRIKPITELSKYIKEYLILHVLFDTGAAAPVKSYPVNPEEGMTFHVKGSLYAESPELGISETRAQTVIFGQPESRQNLYLSHEFLMVHIRFQPGGLFKLLQIPMTEFVHKNIDAELVLGHDIREVHNQLANAGDYNSMPMILDGFFKRKLNTIKQDIQPVDAIGQAILNNPQGFNLEKTASHACLSHRQFEKRFVQQIGITPKHFARICRFYQAFEMKEFHPNYSWLRVAMETGYNDYQHLVKDFKQFAGTTPNTLLQESANNPERRLDIATDFRGV